MSGHHRYILYIVHSVYYIVYWYTVYYMQNTHDDMSSGYKRGCGQVTYADIRCSLLTVNAKQPSKDSPL